MRGVAGVLACVVGVAAAGEAAQAGVFVVTTTSCSVIPEEEVPGFQGRAGITGTSMGTITLSNSSDGDIVIDAAFIAAVPAPCHGYNVPWESVPSPLLNGTSVTLSYTAMRSANFKPSAVDTTRSR